jgi:DNA-binding SARP family transcriptional activator/tetratricopeptide (TPR) repeat protein
MENPLEFRLLGPLEVLSDGVPLTLGGRKQRVLLALLLLEANRVVPTERLIDGLWEDDPPDTAHKALQVYISQLRKLLGRERLLTKPSGYLLRVDRGELDLTRFQELREEGRLGDALELWRGPPLSEFTQERFAGPEVARLEELHLACIEDRIERDLAAGCDSELVAELEALVREHPLRQRMRGKLMLALYRSGREAEALETYRRTRRALVQDLGIEPGRELRELEQQILRHDPGLEASREQAQPESGRGAFVGREQELAELSAALEDAVAGRGRLILLVGEPGIGKSRLAEETIRRARARGIRVLVGRCWEASGAPAYWPWVQALREYVRESEPDRVREQLGLGAAEVAQIVPELHAIFEGLPAPAPLDADVARFRLFDATAEFLRRASRERPLLLFLDDLHAADAPSLLLLRFFARELGASRILLIGACRDVDPIPGRAVAAMLAEVGREPLTTRLSLAGLSEADVATYVELSAAEFAAPELVSALHEETEGNPLFVGEVVRLLMREGEIVLPPSVRDVIARRLSHLSAECNGLLALASVLGREFSRAALAHMSGLSEEELLDTLDEAIAARVMSDQPGGHGNLRFAHVLIRDTLYEGLTMTRRVRLHQLAVAALEEIYGDASGPHLAELAHHAAAGSDFEKALVCAQQAAERALALLAFEEAARLSRTGLDLLELARPTDDQTRCNLLLLLGEAEIAAGNGAVSKEAFLEAADIARRLGLSLQLAQAAAGYGGRIVYVRAGPDAHLVPLLEEALEAIHEEDLELRVRILARLAGALRDEPRRERRDRVSREAVELARSTGNDSALAYALDGRGAAIMAPDTADELAAIGAELFDVATRIHDPERAGYGLIHRFIARLQRGDVPGAEADLATADRLAREHRQASHLWQLVAARAMLTLAQGRFSEGEELSSRALELGEHAFPWLATPVHQLQQYTIHEFCGGLDQMEQPLRQLIIDHPARPIFRCALAYLQTQGGEHSAPKALLEELARDGFSSLPFDLEWTFGTSLLAEIATALEDRPAAATLYRLLAPWADLNVVNMAEGIRGSVSRYLGLLAASLERWDLAAQHFEKALAANETMGFQPWLARTQEDYASLLKRGSSRRDIERAESLLTAARSTTPTRE